MPWADELSDSAPEPAREPFYLLVALKLGDPRPRDWIIENAEQFHDMFRSYFEAPAHDDRSASALIQYILWYERDGPKENSFDNKSTRGT